MSKNIEIVDYEEKTQNKGGSFWKPYFMRLRKDEYSSFSDITPNIGFITTFIVIKTYVMLLFTIMYIVVKESLDQYYSLIEALVSISKIELYAIITFIAIPLIRNLIIWFLRRKGE